MKKTKSGAPRRTTSVIKWIAISACSFALAGAISFFLAVGCGAIPIVRSLWVATAMRTDEHKYLATWFVPQKEIDTIMNAADPDDSNIHSTTQINTPVLSQEELDAAARAKLIAEWDQKYGAQGYQKLSEYYGDQGAAYDKEEYDGIYVKKISGTSFSHPYAGYLMLCVDPSRVKLVDTDRQFRCGATVAQMIERAGAVAGINGGGFNDGPNYDSNGGVPAGIIIEDGELVNPSGGWDGSFRIVGMNDKNEMILKSGSAAWAMENGIHSACSPLSYLIVDGQGQITNGDGGWGLADRTALGQRQTGEVIFAVIDGRQVGYSLSITLRELQDILLEEGCVNAAMMDGGSSTVMETAVYDADGGCTVELVNQPSLGNHDLDSMRYINNAWVIMPPSKNTDGADPASDPAQDSTQEE